MKTTNPVLRTLCHLSVIGAGLVLSSCQPADDPTQDLIDGVFLDSAVAGLSYRSTTQSGVTDENGGFTVDRGEPVQFFIGDLKLPTVLAKETITPLDIFAATSVNDPRVVNLARLLQSLDKDAYPENGIVIDPIAAESATEVDFTSASFEQDVLNLVANSGSSNTALIDSTTAVAHLSATLDIAPVRIGSCGSDHPLVGKSAQLTTRFHDVAGTVTIKDNCTLEIRNFTYDGLGPRVFFYGALDRQYDASTAFAMGPRLDGRSYNRELLTVKLPDEKTLDDMNSISVWCIDARADFGSASFE